MKNAVILGATAGVGRAITEMLTEEGYHTLGFHRGNHKPEFLNVDMLVKQDAIDTISSMMHVVDFCINDPVDVMVHCITGASTGNVLSATRHDIDRTFNGLAHSFLDWAQALRHNGYLNEGSRLIALSNPCPDFYLRNTGVIGAAKAALEAYVKMLAVELGPSGVRVNCVRFGMVRTPAIEKVLNETALQHMQKVNERLMPAGRMQTAEDVAKTVKWLVSDDAYWLNGTIIDATGGSVYTLMDAAFYGPR